MAHYRWVVGDLRTGKINRTIDLPSGDWSTDIEDDGSLGGTADLSSREWRWSRADAAPGKCFLAVAYVDGFGAEHWKAGGPIWTAKFNDAASTLTLGAAALSSYFDHRKVMPVLAASANPAKAHTNYETARLELIAKRLIEDSRAHVGGDLPIVFPTDEELGGEGTERVRNYLGYELGWVGTRLRQLSEVIGGPEFQFEPRRRADDPRFMEWYMRLGTADSGMLLDQGAGEWVFDRSVPKSPITDIDVDIDGSVVSFRSWAPGQGEGEGRPIVYEQDLSRVTGEGWALLESEVSSLDTVSVESTLRGHARTDLAARAKPIETWTLKVDRDAEPHVGRYRAGDWCVVRVRDHIYIPDGDYGMRIVAIGARGTDPVEVSMAPRMGDY
ncbi:MULTISPECIES: hypothetical protein [unclassified Aeromicrobium]|uniref:hypothetical protein n=1 Tax=unclassified Aeromicrobium TaxID=2633570 RepID=UPI00288B9FF9|nr:MULTISPECIES: hypothetical protein [unclassified Aeromicrobium]